MRSICLLLLAMLILLAATARAEPFSPARILDQGMVERVIGFALAFMEPRILEPASAAQLTVWGLRGLTTLDGRLTVEQQEGSIRLRLASFDGQVVLATEAAPDARDSAGWARIAVGLIQTGWNASRAIRAVRTEGVVRMFFDELFNHLDPYSRYEPPVEAAQDAAQRNGSAGIGARLAASRAGFVLRDIDPDGPAAASGLSQGERVLAIDGVDLEGADPDEASALLAGPEDTSVTLDTRGRDGQARTVAVTRILIAPDTVISRRQGSALIIRITRFSGDTARRLARAIATALPDATPASRRRANGGIKGLMLDLRDNRGGLLLQAVAAAETLVASGTLAVTSGRAKQADHVFTADGRDLASELPVVVIVDGRSASAAEILAAALADQRRAVVVGSATLGKGLVQTVAPLPDGGALYVTWSRVLAPLGWPIQLLGVMPQVCTSLGHDAAMGQLRALSDGKPPMARAIERSRRARAPLPPAEALEIRSACPAAEGREIDFTTARYLIDHPAAYEAALIGSP